VLVRRVVAAGLAVQILPPLVKLEERMVAAVVALSDSKVTLVALALRAL
jgi:hypothetical protein